MKQLLNLIFWFLTLFTLAISQDCSGGVSVPCNTGTGSACACGPGYWPDYDAYYIWTPGNQCTRGIGSGCVKVNTTSSLATSQTPSQTPSDCNGGVLMPCINGTSSISVCACGPGYEPILGPGAPWIWMVDKCSVAIGYGCKTLNTTSS
jgi:hypothetical protein